MGGIHYLIENISTSDVVLDVGSKTGEDMAKLPCDTVAIDINFQDTSEHTEYILADGTRLPFKQNSFDYILCSQVLEHIKNTENIIKEISRVLKPTGEALFNFPNRLAPKAPHSPPWWYSYLPRAVGIRLSEIFLDKETAEYYKTSEFMLTPLKSRLYLNRHFTSVRYDTFKYKYEYQTDLVGELNNRHHDLIFYLSSPLSKIESLPIIGWAIELIYPNVGYICSNGSPRTKH